MNQVRQWATDDYDYGDELEPEDPDVSAEDDDPCRHCGPQCESWGGDGICMIEIRRQAYEWENYFGSFVRDGEPCPVCQVPLTRYDVPSDDLWHWPADGQVSALLGLAVYGAYDVPKGEVHRMDNTVHIWRGSGENRDERLIRLTGRPELPVVVVSTEPAAPSEEEGWIPF